MRNKLTPPRLARWFLNCLDHYDAQYYGGGKYQDLRAKGMTKPLPQFLKPV